MSWLWAGAARRLVLAAAAVVTLLAGPGVAQERKPGPIGPQTGPYREQEWFIAWERAERTYLAHAKIFRPEGEERRPVALLAHGSPGNENDRMRMSPNSWDSQARWFAAQGFVVVVPMRRGYGKSDGPFTEGPGSCEKSNFLSAGLTIANDIQGVLRHMAREPYVDPSRTIVVGQSAGGLGAMAIASRNPEGVMAVVNFAGGLRIRDGSGYCRFDRLIEDVGKFGSQARIPSLWIYTENDSFFYPSVSRPMAEAYRAGGAPAEFNLLSAFGKDGHALFHETAGQRAWVPLVTEFLRAQKLMK